MATKRKRSKPVLLTADLHRKEMIRLLRENAMHHHLWTIWQDFVEIGAIAFSNAVDLAHRETREARYKRIEAKYDPTQLSRFAEALAHLVSALEIAGFDDVLGRTYMELELGNKWAGQFFTPYHLSQLLAQLLVDDTMHARVQERGFITASDPCVGGGAMVIALAHAMHDAGLPYQQCLHVTAQDVDSTAVHMAYLQLSLLSVPAMLIVGNTLAMETREHWYTPAHVLGGWTHRLMASRSTPAESDVLVRLESSSMQAELASSMQAELEVSSKGCDDAELHTREHQHFQAESA